MATNVVYSTLLTYIYLDEIVTHWSYMGFHGLFSFAGLALSGVLILIMGAIFPLKDSVGTYILVTLMFFLFIPSIIFFSYSQSGQYHAIVFVIAISIVIFFSQLKIPMPNLAIKNGNTYLYGVVSIVLLALIAQALFGGLENFNLDIERVYDFRREAADKIHPVFAYVYSNVSSALIPIIVVNAIKNRQYAILFLSMIMTVFMFGMSHHKSVLFGPIFVAILYLFFSFPKLRSYMVLIFLLVPVLSLIEISYVRSISSGQDFAYATSLIIRRVLFVPVMIDGAYVEFFSSNEKYFWSYSKIFSWAIQSPYNVTPPFLIGYEYFVDLDTSANAGIIGSGFANAGSVGVLLYAAITGLLISIFNYFGEIIDRPAVAAICLTTVHNVMASADLLTAFLSHGLLLLIILLAFHPRKNMKTA